MIIKYNGDPVVTESFFGKPNIEKLDLDEYELQGYESAAVNFVRTYADKIDEAIKEEYAAGKKLMDMIDSGEGNDYQQKENKKLLKQLFGINKKLKKSRSKMNRLKVKNMPPLKREYDELLDIHEEIVKAISPTKE